MKTNEFCRRCLAKEMPDKAFFQNMYEYIAQLDEDIKVADETYQIRLAACKQCDNLLNGICRVCGCFVEMRAAIAKNECPAVNPKWESKVILNGVEDYDQ